MKPSSAAKAATLHDVARLAGVSLITASRALSKPELVSDKTIARVQEAVAQTGYLPNLMAGGLKSRRSQMVAGIIPALSVAQFLPTLQTLTETLAQSGYQLILGQTGYDVQREEALINTMISRRPDGLFMTGLVHAAAARERLQKAGIPVVESWDFSPQPVDMLVGFSHPAVGAAIADYFRRQGRQRVGIASANDPRALQRCAGFEARWGQPVPTALVPAPSGLARGREALSALLAQSPALEAVYCSSDQMAQGVLVEAQARGLRVPEDLALCGFGNAEFSAHMVPALTTVHVDGAGIGQRAAQMILQRCAGQPVTEPVQDMGFSIIERRSTERAAT
ncbi:LacI family DNA-binding transcriptional regulator [Curvibacter sp. HBC61]|uniref:LacI family DNA-binding transcriptional regulator n=1 Tax=Curvibacter cyanobacteriorum TaxID=3026422 RepID=A0ABT5MSV0_9BURK|nr:LacI family DNA-binding transcriptional regulator [Curvibacter sp. HBC61]MDD0837124.1 LacI family DNA-binding transcriptional regulator [Curvibacter sp. HBC61]